MRENMKLPPVRPDLHEIEKQAQPSVIVLVKVERFAGVRMGRYIHGLGEWQADGISGFVKVLEWWPLPEPGTGIEP